MKNEVVFGPKSIDDYRLSEVWIVGIFRTHKRRIPFLTYFFLDLWSQITKSFSLDG